MSISFQGSFTGGELDPSLKARVDLAKYGIGCAKLENFIVQPHGGAYRRPGTSFILEALGATRLIPFQYNVAQAYVLAFSNLKMRVLKDGGVVLDSSASKTITAITKASPCQVTATAHNLVTGDDVYISGVGGMTELNGRFFTVTRIDNDIVTLDGLDSTGYTTFTSGGTLAKVYTVTSPFATAHLDDIYFAQSADTMYLCHPSYAPRKLTRADHDDWTFSTVSLGTSMTAPTGLGVDWKGAANLDASKAITGATQASPVVVTAVGHLYTTNDEVYISGVVGMTEINDRFFRITWLSVDTFSLDDEDGTGHTAYTSDGISEKVKGLVMRFKVTSVNTDGEESLPTAAVEIAGFHSSEWVAGDNVHLDWTAASGALQYNIYKERNGIYGFAGSTVELLWRDDNYDPDLLYTPPENYDPFSGGADYYPATVSFFKQRLWYAGSNNFPQTLWASQVGIFENFNKSTPLKDSDSLEFTLASVQVNAVKWLASFGNLLVGTAGAEWSVFSSVEGAITPSTTDADVESYWGSAGIAPIIVGDSVVHIQAQGGKLRDLFFSMEKDSYSGNDLTVLVNHLFQGKTVISWAYQRSPDSIIWCILSDGSLVGLTYLKEQQVWGWHKHVTDGTFESVAVIPGAIYDDVYFIVNRTIQTATVRYIEKLNDKWLLADGIDAAMFLDSSLSYSGSSETEFAGLDHLEGETVSAMVDGSPVANLVVADGIITLSVAGTVVHVGMPMTSTLAPMGVESIGKEVSSVGRVKSVAKVTVRFAATVGGRIGPTETYTWSLKFSPDVVGEAIVPEEILDYEFIPPANYDRDASFFIIQDQPLPMTVLALMPEFIVGGM